MGRQAKLHAAAGGIGLDVDDHRARPAASDEFILDAVDLAPGLVTAAVSEQAGSLKNPPRTVGELLVPPNHGREAHGQALACRHAHRPDYDGPSISSSSSRAPPTPPSSSSLTASSILRRTRAARAASDVAAKPLLAPPTRASPAATTGHSIISRFRPMARHVATWSPRVPIPPPFRKP